MPDRTIPTITVFIKRNIRVGTIIKTGDYPSHPSSFMANRCRHIKVNHSRSFIDEYGNHTNLIEGVWAGAKAEIGARKDVRYDNLKLFIEVMSFYLS